MITKLYQLNKNIICNIIFICELIITTCFAYGQQFEKKSERWDKRTIEEALIWQNLLVNYWNANYTLYWPERKKALIAIIEKFPDSQWADDAAILLAGGKASIEKDIPGAIEDLKKIIRTYKNASTIIKGWDSERGCLISEAWLMWAPSLVFINNNIVKTLPFDRDSNISILENEALAYFEHLERFPQRTKDLAQYIMASMLYKQGDTLNAITELENLLAACPDLSVIRATDYEAAKKPYGYFIECEPPFEVLPIWRVQYEAFFSLIELYKLSERKDKAIELSEKLVAGCSPDGWYWNINRQVGDINSKYGNWDLAAEQYDLSLKGINNLAKVKASELKLLVSNGYLIKHKDPTDWENEALKIFVPNIQLIDSLKEKSLKNNVK
jgi:tetratricopeptide (TPR) repeat protein